MTRHLFLGSTRILMILGCLAAAGCGEKTVAGKSKEAPRVTVAHPATRSLMDEDDYNGWLEAFKTVDVRARVRGHITKVHFQDGDLVKEGQDLFELDAAPLVAQRGQAEAQAAALEAQEVSAKADLERNRILMPKNAVSQQDLDKSEADAKSFAAQIVAKKAEAKRYALDVDYASIKAPLSGKIGKANLVVGDLVNAGGTDPMLATIVDRRSGLRRFQCRRARHPALPASQMPVEPDKQKSLREREIKFTFGLDTEKGFPHEGKLVFADIKYAEGTGTILVRGVAENKRRPA